MDEAGTTDAVLARTLLEGALAVQTKPSLTAEQVDNLFATAGTAGDDGMTVYTGAALNQAAATGWNWKTALVSDAYEIAAGEGRSLKRQQWFDQCREMARLYGTGEMDVLPAGNRGDTSEASATGTVVEIYSAFLGHGG